MPVLQSAGAGSEQSGQAATPAGLFIDLAAELERLRQDVYTLTDIVESLRGKYNAHAHVENAAASYTQNATTAPPPAASQVTVTTITG